MMLGWIIHIQPNSASGRPSHAWSTALLLLPLLVCFLIMFDLIAQIWTASLERHNLMFESYKHRWESIKYLSQGCFVGDAPRRNKNGFAPLFLIYAYPSSFPSHQAASPLRHVPREKALWTNWELMLEQQNEWNENESLLKVPVGWKKREILQLFQAMKSEMISCVGRAFRLSLISLGLLCSEETGTLIKFSPSLQTSPSWTFCSACIVVANVAWVWCSLVQSSGCTLMKKRINN